MTCSCKGEFWVRDRLAGTSTPCPSCGLSLDVPPFESVRANLSPATCSCGEVFWSSAWQPGKLSQCPVCGDVVGPLKSDGEATVILPPGAGDRPSRQAQGGLGAPAHPRAQPGVGDDAMRTTAAATREEPLAVGSNARARGLAWAGGLVFLLAAGVLVGSRWAASLPEEGSPGPPPESADVGGVEGLGADAGQVEVARADLKPAPVPPTADRGRSAPMKILIPAYFYPGASGLDDWKCLVESARRVPIVAVVNPASGPGEAPIRDYSDIVRGGSATPELTMIGYVNTGYAKRPRPEIVADIDRWVQFYPEIQGIFLDAQSEEAKDERFYADLSNYARQAIDDALIVTNPGKICPEVYFEQGTADVAIVFENSCGFDEFDLPFWRFRYRPDRFAALPYGLETVDAMEEALRQASGKGIGYLFVSDGVLPNPWDGLPPYWAELVDAVEALNAGHPRPACE